MSFYLLRRAAYEATHRCDGARSAKFLRYAVTKLKTKKARQKWSLIADEHEYYGG